MAQSQSVDENRAEVVEETQARLGIGVRSAIEIGRDVLTFEVPRSVIGDQIPLLVLVDCLDESSLDQLRQTVADCPVGNSIPQYLRIDFDTAHTERGTEVVENLKNAIIGLSHPLRPSSHYILSLMRRTIVSTDSRSRPKIIVGVHKSFGEILSPCTLTSLLTGNSRGPGAQWSTGLAESGLGVAAPVRVGSRDAGTKAMYDNDIRGLNSPVTTAELPQNCPTCDTPIEGVDACAPSNHRLAPRGCTADFGLSSSSEPQLVTDGGVSWFDLTGFQADLLLQIYELDQPSGQAIRRALESEHEEPVNHGRLYPNLDALVDYGLIEKGEQDRRTNYYEATPGGRELVEHRAQRFASATSRVAADGGQE